MSESRYPHLSQLFGAFMHQDWGYEGKDWPDLVSNFTRDEKTVDITVVAAEIDRLLTDFPDDAALHDQLYRVLNCCYDPRPDLVDRACEFGWRKLPDCCGRAHDRPCEAPHRPR
jgi:hypothetical protein